MNVRTLSSTLLLLIFVGAMNHANSQSTTKEFTDKFFSLYSKDLTQAVDYAFSTNSGYRDSLSKKGADNVKSNLLYWSNESGNYNGYDKISEKAIAPSLVIEDFLLKYDSRPIELKMILYKPKNVWMLSDFWYETNIDTIAEFPPLANASDSTTEDEN